MVEVRQKLKDIYSPTKHNMVTYTKIFHNSIKNSISTSI